jgi:hypothetical protein
MIYTDIQGISSFDYAQNRGLYFCRSVFEVYLREKNNHSRPSTTRSFNNNSTIKKNGYDVTPTPPVNGHATFIRRNGRRSLNESLPTGNHSSSVLSVGQFSRTTNLTRLNDDDDDDEDFNRQRYRPPSSSTTNTSLPAPPIKPRKSSTTPNSSIVNVSKPQQNNHHNNGNAIHSEDEDEANSLQGHGSESDGDDDQFFQHERPDSRLSLRNGDDQSQQQSNVVLRRPHYKPTKQSNRNSLHDDYRHLDEQQSSSSNKSKPPNTRITINKEFLQPSSNRIGSGNGNQSTTNRLKSGSKSSSTESIPTLDLTVAGQKVFRPKQQSEISLSNSLPSTNTMRPPSGRLKPISSAKSSSSYTDELSSISTKTLEDVTNNVKQSSPTKIHLYKKKLAPLANGNDATNKKYSYRPLIDQQQYIVDDVPSDRSEETTTGGGNRDIKSSNGSDKRSKYH